MAERAFAPAKINLTLHVTGQRADGYHLLDSLVVFADIGDSITAEPANELCLSVDGPMAGSVPADDSNLMIKAARFLDADRGASLRLVKHLPPASGIGGGSSDAAATLRALSALWQLPCPAPQDTLPLGADLPVCMVARAQRMSGIGDVLARVPALPALDILLVNPGVSVSTPAVFGRLERRDNPAMPDRLPSWRDAVRFCQWLTLQRNDLTAPAIALQPVIAEVLDAVRATDPLFAGMSGSGATCFGLFPPDGLSAKKAHREIEGLGTDWWVAHGCLL